jgi:hypothetical protein
MPATRERRHGRRRTPTSWMAFDDHRIPQPPPCKCSAPCRLVCPALAGLRQPLAPVSGVHAVDAVSVTEPVTVIHWYVQCGSCPGRRSLLPHRSSVCWSQPNVGDLVGPHVVPLVEGKRRELDRRDVCPGGPTGQHRAADPAVESSTRGLRMLESRSRLRRVHVPGPGARRVTAGAEAGSAIVRPGHVYLHVPVGVSARGVAIVAAAAGSVGAVRRRGGVRVRA